MKAIKKYWGIGLIVMLLASLMIAPVSTTSAGTLAFSNVGMPNPAPGGVASNQILAGSNIGIVKVAPNGDIFAVNNMGAAKDTVYKSVNGGQSWTTTTATGAPWAAADIIVDLVISPSYETDNCVMILVNTATVTNVYVSSNAGSSFAQLGGNIGAGGNEDGTSIALEPTYTYGTGQILVSTADYTTPGAGDIYSWGTNGVLNWVNTAFGTGGTLGACSVDKVVFSPLYPVDSTVIAITSTATTIDVQYKVSTNAWGANIALQNINAGTWATPNGISIAFPSDFNASIATSRNFYVGIGTSAGTDNVYRVKSNGAAAFNPTGTADQPVSSIYVTGSYASGTLYVAYVGSTAIRYSTNASTAVIANVTFSTASKAPTGPAASNPVIAAVGDTVYVGTGIAAAAAADETAFSVSYDAGKNFYQIGLIDTVITTVTDVALASATEWYMATTDAGAGLESLWKSTDGGSTWLRIHTLATATNLVQVILSTNFATDATMYFCEVGGVAGSLIHMSQNSGDTWTPRAYPTAITTVGNVIAVDQYVLYVADASAATSRVFKSLNNGWTWASQTLTGATGVFQLKLDAGTGHLLAGDTVGKVWLSANGSTWTAQDNVAAVPAGNTCVAFDSGYATNNTIYAGSAAGTGVFRWYTTNTSSAAWFNVDPGAVTAAVADIFVAPDGCLYASDPTAGTGGIFRLLVPTSGSATPAVAPAPAGAMIVNGLAAGYVLGAIDYLPGSNIIYTVDATAVKLVSYTDTLSTPIPVVVSPADGDVITATNITVVIEPVTGATAHQVQWSMRSDYNVGVNGATEAFLGSPFNSRRLGATQGAANQPLAGQIVYYRVRVSAPIVGPWSQTFMVNTQLAAAAAPNAPAIVQIAGTEGATANGGFNVSPNPSFFWGVIANATSYEFQLASDAAFANLVVDASGTNALSSSTTAYSVTGLDYSTTYYWRVRALSATSFTSWSAVQAFTVMDEPAAAPTASAPVTTTVTAPAATVITPTIVLPTQPVVTPTITVAPPAETEIAPAYIWAIIIIGAVLVIAVIVLVVRTRRSV